MSRGMARFGSSFSFLVAVSLVTASWAAELDLSTAEILNRQGPSVVVIEVLNRDGEQTGQASGIVLRRDGIIVTNFHVLQHACQARVRLSARKDTLPIKTILATDKDSDLAVFRIESVGLAEAKTGISANLKVGDPVVAIGNPMGLEQSVSEGIVSGIRKTDSGDWIQITAPISPGSSGGGLYSRQGELVGITTFLLRESQNLNFAVPIEKALAMIDLRSSYPELPEIAWSEVSDRFCQGDSAVIDWMQVSVLLGRHAGDSTVQELLRKLSGGAIPSPEIGFVRGVGESRSYDFRNLGVHVGFLNGVCTQIDLWVREVHYSDGRLAFKPFSGTLPFGIAWSSTRSDVTKYLGPPTGSQRFDQPGLGNWRTMDTYDVGGQLHSLSYTDSGELVLITVGR
jgi:hypothetical protein